MTPAISYAQFCNRIGCENAIVHHPKVSREVNAGTDFAIFFAAFEKLALWLESNEAIAMAGRAQ